MLTRSRVSRSGRPPVAGMRHRSDSEMLRWKAIQRPSGEYAGDMSTSVSVFS
jgi:hypothetical protein